MTDELSSMTQCVYAGVFDPPHKGHEDIINRLAKIFDNVTVAILRNEQKKPVLDEGARARLMQTLYADDDRVTVRVFDGLLSDFCRKEKIFTVARGIRNAGDLEYEKQLAAVYKSQNYEIEVIYLHAAPPLAHISSGIVKELIKLGGNISEYVPEILHDEILTSYTAAKS